MRVFEARLLRLDAGFRATRGRMRSLHIFLFTDLHCSQDLAVQSEIRRAFIAWRDPQA